MTGLALIGLAGVYLYLLSYDFNRLKPEIISAVKNATGRQLTIQGDMKVALGLSPSLVIEKITFENAVWGSRPQMLQVKRFELQLALLPLLSGTLEVRRAALIDAEIFIEVSGKGALNLPALKTDAPEPQTDSDGPLFLPEIALKDIRIVNSRLLYKGRLARRPIRLQLNRLKLKSVSPSGSSRLALTGRYKRQPLSATGTLGALDGLLDPETPWPFTLSVNSVGAKLTLDGTIKDVFKVRGIALDFKFASRDISKTAGAADVRLPFKADARLSGHLSGDLDEALKFSKLKLHTGRNDLEGFVLGKLKGGKPYFNVTVTAKRLDLRPPKKKKTAPAKPKTASSVRKVFSAKPFPVGWMQKADADVGVRIKRCLFARSALQNLKLNLALKNGRLKVKPITATIGSGQLRASAALREIKRKWVLRADLDIRRLNAGRMLRELEISDALEGEFDINTAFSGRGRSPAQFMGGINGHVRLIMGKGRLNNRLLGVLGGDLRAGLFQLLSPGGKSGELTEINCLAARFDAVDGMAASRVLVLDTPALRAMGKGTVNLKTEQLDISIKPIPQKGVGAEGIGKISLSLGSLAKPFKLGGTLANPELAVDAKHAAITLGKAIGGFALFGPFGLAALLVDGDTGKKDLCATAKAIALQKHKIPPKKQAPSKSPSKKKAFSPGKLMDGLKKMLKSSPGAPDVGHRQETH